MDRFHAMRLYVRVARLGSFSRAADDLGLSRAAVSEAIAALERHLGVGLLTRTTRRVTPTAEGVDFLARAERILGEVSAAEEALRGARAKPKGRLRVDVPTAFGQVLLMPALPDFMKRYPELELDVRFNDRIVDLVAEQVDVAVRVGVVQPPSYVARRIATTRSVICGSPDYFASAGRPQRPEDLRGHRLIGMLNNATGRTNPWRFRGGRAPKLAYALVLNQAEAAVSAALAGAGLIQTIDLMTGESLARGRLESVLESWLGEGPPISVVYPQAQGRSAKVHVFADFAAALLDGYRRRLGRPA